MRNQGLLVIKSKNMTDATCCTVPDYGSFVRTHRGNLSGTHFDGFGVSRAV
jgi:hypothetical protein